MNVILGLKRYVTLHCRGRNILYIGAGNQRGKLAPAAADVLSVSASWFGLDLDPEVARRNPDLQITVQDLNEEFHLDLPAIDLVVMTEVLEHLRNPVRTLQQLATQCPGVEFLGSVPNGTSIGRILMAMLTPTRCFRQDGTHLMLFNHSTITNVLVAAGMRQHEIVSYQHRWWLYPLTRLCPLLGSGFIVHGYLPKSR